ncbi:hypothetical protein ACH5RR_005987 [Cinchona calisaya]|uniref:Uncharacterized protein n=1 Tax=Cinchona calisaya TaxID=153742 RepID=A0ABD3AMR4_9GENT
MIALPRDVAYVTSLTPQQRLDELHVSLMNAITILLAVTERETSFNSAINSMKQELGHAQSGVYRKVKEAFKANEMKCNIEAGKKYNELKAEMTEVRDKLRQAELKKKTLEVDVSNQDKRIANLEKRVLQIHEEAQMAEAEFASRENELRIQGRNEFVASDEADGMLKEFTKKVFSMGFALACDHFVKNPDLYRGWPYDASVAEEVINGLQAQFKAPVPIPVAPEATALNQGGPSTAGPEAESEPVTKPPLPRPNLPLQLRRLT